MFTAEPGPLNEAVEIESDNPADFEPFPHRRFIGRDRDAIVPLRRQYGPTDKLLRLCTAIEQVDQQAGGLFVPNMHLQRLCPTGDKTKMSLFN